MLLTDSKIRNAKPRAKPYRLSDGERLALLVKPNGSKLWHFRYEFAEKEKTLSIGKYPRVSLADAREKKRAAQKLLNENIDPSAKKQQEKIVAAYSANDTVEKLSREWFEHKSPQWSKKYASNTIRRLELHVFPYIGKRSINSVSPLDVLDTVQRLEKARKTELSHRVLELMEAVFRRAVVTGRLTSNPATGLSKELLAHKTENMKALTEAELPQFIRAIDQYPFKSEVCKPAFWLLMLTAVRQNELRYSKKSDICLEKKEWVLRPEITKMRREHIVSLSSQAVAVLKQLMDLTPQSEWLVPSKQGSKHPVMSENTINYMIDCVGYKGRVVGHGFRSMFTTILNDHGFDSRVVDRQLAHVGRDKIEAIYNRAEYESQRREMMQWWGDFLDAKRPNGKRFCTEGFGLSGSFSGAITYRNRVGCALSVNNLTPHIKYSEHF